MPADFSILYNKDYQRAIIFSDCFRRDSQRYPIKSGTWLGVTVGCAGNENVLQIHSDSYPLAATFSFLQFLQAKL